VALHLWETLEIKSLKPILLTISNHISRNSKYGKSQIQEVNHRITYTDDKNGNKLLNSSALREEDVNSDIDLMKYYATIKILLLNIIQNADQTLTEHNWIKILCGFV
jgi:hypothetical protein